MEESLWPVWEATVAAAPDRVAVIDAAAGRAILRSELSAEATRASSAAPADLEPSEVVAFSARNGVPWLTLFLAIQKLGAVALPLDAALPADQQPATAAALGAHWLVRDGEWRRLAASPPKGGFCLAMYTSGTTGRPKALWFTAANMLADGRQICATMEIGPDDINLGAAPFGHSYGLGNLILPLIMQGTPIVCSQEMLPDAIAGQVERHGVTVFPSAPAIFRALAESSVKAARLASLRRVISAGAPMPAAAATRFWERFGRPIHNFYGSSETGGICFDRTGEATASGRSIGAPLERVDVQLSPENQVVVTSAAVFNDGVHTLPDLGHWNAAGELALTGRVTPLANIGGRKVAPQEIENVLRALDQVTDAWVGIGARPGGDCLLAAVETDRPKEDIVRDLSARLPLWQVPRHLWVNPELPRTARGKIDRAELEARCAAISPRDAPPRS